MRPADRHAPPVQPLRLVWRGRCLQAALLLAAGAQSGFADDGIQIIGGSPTSQWPGIGALVTADGELVCTGALVGPELVLTAAHCMDSPEFLPAHFLVGPDSAQPQRAYDVAQIHVHPAYSAATLANDIALVRLDASASEPLLALRTTPLTGAVVGTDVRIVGYGRDAAGVTGIKRTAVTQIDFLDATLLGVGLSGAPQACAGDSGGPMITTTTAIPLIHGVSSFGLDANCTTGAFYHRVETAAVSTFLAGFDRVCFQNSTCSFPVDLVFRDGFEPP
jgi:secreted trypsin-like serine protease